VKCYSPWTDKLKYVVYDKPLSGYTNGMRRMLLMREFKDIKDGPVSLVFNKVAHSYEEIERWHEVFVQQGYEGAIIRNMDGKYVAGRSGNLMKLKRFDTTEFTILDVVEAAGQDKGTGLFILSASGGNRFHARPTGPKSLRASYLRDRESLKGKQCTVRHFGYTDGGVIPRFPVALGIRDYE
jgi:DNA ligase-1